MVKKLKSTTDKLAYMRAYYVKNKKRHNERSNAYYVANKAKKLKYMRAYRLSNKIKLAVRARVRYILNKDRIVARDRAYYLANKSQAAAHRRMRRAVKLKAKGRHTRHDINRLYFKQQGRCVSPHCRASLANGYHVDHKNPLSRGGSDYPRNLQLMCQPCNDSKGTRTMKEWLQWLVKLGKVERATA